MPKIIKTSLLLAPILFAATVLAANVHEHSHGHDHHKHHSHQEQKPHVHGVSHIELAIGDEEIELHFESPADSIVGFEHTAETSNEIQAVEQAKSHLSKAASLFTFSGTSCKSLSTVVDVHSLLSTHDHQRESSHKEVKAEYHFQCELPALTEIKFGFFDQFPNITEIQVQWISETKQGMAVLTQKNNQLDFGG